MKKGKIVSRPLRRFSWPAKSERDERERLVESTIIEWYLAKHRRQCREEIGFINSNQPKSCPYCECERISRNGYTSDGIQRFVCNGCKKRFSPLTGTIFDSRKIPISEWGEYLLHLFEFHSIRSSAYDNRNADSTGRYWLQKVFLVLDGIQDSVILGGRVYIDEKFFSVVRRDIVTRDGKGLRGISRNKICIATGTNESSSFAIATGVSKLSESSSLKAYGNHIAKGSCIVHDMEKSHNILIERLGLKSEAYDSDKLKGLPDSNNPLEPINRLHDMLAKFMASHGGFDRREIQDWLNLFWFISNGPKDKYDKVLLFLKMAIQKRCMVRYRDTFGSKDAMKSK